MKNKTIIYEYLGVNKDIRFDRISPEQNYKIFELLNMIQEDVAKRNFNMVYDIFKGSKKGDKS